jgi:hypothetical protein
MRVEAERIHHARLASSIPILKHYIEGRAAWIFDVQPPNEIYEVWERLGGPPRISSMDVSSFIFQVNVANGGVVQNWDQEPVLVSRVELVNGPNVKIPSVVRLYFAHDEVEEAGSGDVYLQVPQGIFKSIGIGINGKLSSLPIASWYESGNCFKPSVIEGALKIVNGIPEHDSQAFGGVSILDVCKVTMNEFAASVRIYLGTNDQSFFQAVDSKLNIRNVMVGPFDLEAGTFAKRHATMIPPDHCSGI